MSRRFQLLLVSMLGGCGPRFEPLPAAESAGGGSSTGETTGAITSSTSVGASTTIPDDTTTVALDGDDEGCSFLCEDIVYEGGEGCWGCSIWDDCCDEGTKCMPWANDGGRTWNSNRCSPIADEAVALGEPCHAEGSGVSGIDDCAAGLMCFWVDPVTNEGTCVAQCEGSSALGVCSDPDTICVRELDDVVTLCLPTCDPLAQDCAHGGCYPVGPEPTGFACGQPLVPLAADGAPCEYHWDCLPGSACVEGLCVAL